MPVTREALAASLSLAERGRAVVTLAIVALAVMLAGCVPGSAPNLPAGPDTAAILMTRALDQFATARSYRFQSNAVHSWEFEGQRQDWVYVGQGGYAAPESFYSHMEGPADSFLRVTVDGGQVTAADSKGPVANPSLAWGGPGNGASPLTAIAYLRNQQQVSGFSVTTLNDEEVYAISFIPNVQAVAALDAGQKDSIDRVDAVEGQVWIEKNSNRIRQEQVTVRSTDASGKASSVEMTLRFSDFDRPVTIQSP